jgi:hypothetical protein
MQPDPGDLRGAQRGLGHARDRDAAGSERPYQRVGVVLELVEIDLQSRCG